MQLFAFAVALRFAVFVIASTAYHLPIERFANKTDGQSYVRYAKAILGEASALSDYDRRVFPGYPTLIALAHLAGLSFPLAALGVDWLSAGAAAALAGAIFPDARVGWAMLILVPNYLCNSTMAMSEAPLLASTLAGVLLAFRASPIAAGVLFGCAGLIRPMACFAVAGVAIALLCDRRQRRALALVVATAVTFALGVAALHHFSGDALRGVRVYRDSPSTYGGQIFEPPFHALATIPFAEHVPVGFVAYIYAHVAVVLLGLGLLARRCWTKPNPLDLAAFAWLLGNTAFELCIGRTWGFRHFPRFAIPAQPALFWAICPILPKAKWPWWLATAGIGALAVVSVNLTP